MIFRWTKRRDRILAEARMDGFTFREAANMVGSGCTSAEAKARMRALLAEHAGIDEEIPERAVWYGSQGPQHPVIGPDLAEQSSPPVKEGEAAVDGAPPPPCEFLERAPACVEPVQPVLAGPAEIAAPPPMKEDRRFSVVAQRKIGADRVYYFNLGLMLPNAFFERAAIACLGEAAFA